MNWNPTVRKLYDEGVWFRLTFEDIDYDTFLELRKIGEFKTHNLAHFNFLFKVLRLESIDELTQSRYLLLTDEMTAYRCLYSSNKNVYLIASTITQYLKTFNSRYHKLTKEKLMLKYSEKIGNAIIVENIEELEKLLQQEND